MEASHRSEEDDLTAAAAAAEEAPSSDSRRTVKHQHQHEGDFLSPNLQPNEIRSIQWSDTGLAVSEHGYLMGLRPRLRESLLEYSDYMGITAMMKDLTAVTSQHRLLDDQDQATPNIRIKLRDDLDWFIQRTAGVKQWNSNMHWISPSDGVSYSHFLKALGVAGFDEVLEAIGKHFGYRGLVAYHLSFLAVSKCDPGTFHVDATNTGGKSMNILIPLLLADDTGPELNLSDDQVREPSTSNDGTGTGKYKYKGGQLRYQYNVAALVGDEVYHATSRVDYHQNHHQQAPTEMRLLATIYVADVSYSNISAVLDDHVTYEDSYPPRNEPTILLELAGAHWKYNDPSKKLPF
ncbi:expressed unknown protein [Seminavis robusta]|uniref:Uncharacterized protein n=1 Tax=Seminavis robusta TaxID=568900 RepID=A0A9N8E2A8_9STRA|nr:expressed unknown protein [Seminavis robusta]|eukprot:Sro546_g164140.1 n/a (349) ;mRNA; f:56355-57401